MDTLSAFMMGESNRGKDSMVFDWNKAARLIKESGCKNASAGLDGDWDYTGGLILENGKIPDDTYTYLASTWATPLLEIDGETQECYVLSKDSDGWDSRTFWPKSAKEIMGFK